MKLEGLILGLGAVLVLPPVTRGENEIGRLTSVGNASMRRHYQYDVLGRVASEVQVLDGTPYTYRYGYGDALSEVPSRGPGRVRTDTTFPGGEKVCFGYDSRGQLKSLTARCEGAAQSVVSSVSYDALGRAVQTRFGNGAITNSCYNPVDFRLDRRRTSFTPEACGSWSGTPVQDHAYSYDPVGNVKTVQDLVPGVPASFSATYGYDSLDRLASRTSGASTLHYTYDASGNLVGKEVAAAGARNQSYGGTDRGPHALNVANQVTHTYDLNGNLVSATDGTSIGWNTENMATTVTSSGAALNKSFLGESLWKRTEGAGTTYFLPLLRIENGRHRNFYDSFAERSAEDGQLRFYHPDHLGSSTAMTDLARTVAHRSAFMPYGEDIGQAGGSFLPKQRFNFKDKEATGLYDFGARLYNPATGRWLSADSSTADGVNRYAYVLNNPLGHTDPTGHQAKPVQLPNPVVPPVKLVPFVPRRRITPPAISVPVSIDVALFEGLMQVAAHGGRRLSFQQASNAIQAINPLVNACIAYGCSKAQLAYVMATAVRETDWFNTMHEYASGLDYEPGTAKGKRLGNIAKGDGPRYKGTGFVQITGRSNYESWEALLASQGSQLPLVDNPNLADWPALSATITVAGMLNGTFTGKPLTKYVNEQTTDFRNARRSVNGLDHAGEIAGNATIFLSAVSPAAVSYTPSPGYLFQALPTVTIRP